MDTACVDNECIVHKGMSCAGFSLVHVPQVIPVQAVAHGLCHLAGQAHHFCAAVVQVCPVFGFPVTQVLLHAILGLTYDDAMGKSVTL